MCSFKLHIEKALLGYIMGRGSACSIGLISGAFSGACSVFLTSSYIVMAIGEATDNNSFRCTLGKCKKLDANFPSLKAFTNHKQ